MILGLDANDTRITYNLFKMQIRDRYLGSRIGIFWAFVQPLLLFSIYIYVFGFVFQSKIPGSSTSLTYVVWLIAGYAPWMTVSEAIVSSASSVLTGSSLVKNLTFKTELLPIASVLSGIFPMIMGLIVLLPLLVIEGTGLSINLLWLLIVIPLQLLFLAGIGLFLSAVCVFYRDIVQVLPSLLIIILFFSPIFYPFNAMPTIIQKINFLNPFFHIVNLFRVVLIDQHMPSYFSLLFVLISTLFLWYFGLKFFRKLKGEFQSCL